MPKAPAGRKRPRTQRKQLEGAAQAASNAVRQAAAVLEGELASGLVGIRRMQERFTGDRHVDQSEFNAVLEQLRTNAHDLIALAAGRVADLRSDDVQDLSQRFTADAHEVVDTLTGLVGLAPDIINRLSSRFDSAVGTPSAAGRTRARKTTTARSTASGTSRRAAAKPRTTGRASK